MIARLFQHLNRNTIHLIFVFVIGEKTNCFAMQQNFCKATAHFGLLKLRGIHFTLYFIDPTAEVFIDICAVTSFLHREIIVIVLSLTAASAKPSCTSFDGKIMDISSLLHIMIKTIQHAGHGSLRKFQRLLKLAASE